MTMLRLAIVVAGCLLFLACTLATLVAESRDGRESSEPQRQGGVKTAGPSNRNQPKGT